MNWHQERIQDIEKQMSEILKLLHDSEMKLVYENDLQEKGKLEQNIKRYKEQLNTCDKELNYHNSQNNLATLVTFEDFDFVIKALLELDVPTLDQTDDFLLTAPEIKMSKNKLTKRVRKMLTSGLAQSKEVNHFIQRIAKVSFPDIPERLIATLKDEYFKLTNSGLKGDDLFIKMHEFVSCSSKDLSRQIAGLGVLCYFFHTCDIFEP